MPKGYPSLSLEQKQQVIVRIKEKGETVQDLAKEYGVPPKTIYNMLARSGQSSGTILELAKLKREKEALVRIIGQMLIDQKLGKKTQHGSRN